MQLSFRHLGWGFLTLDGSVKQADSEYHFFVIDASTYRLSTQECR